VALAAVCAPRRGREGGRLGPALGLEGRTGSGHAVDLTGLRRPSLDLAVAINRAVRSPGERSEGPDELHRVQAALDALHGVDDPLAGAARVAARVARAQGFAEGNKRTALLLAAWTLDHNGVEATRILPPEDRVVPTLLVRASMGADVEAALGAVLAERSCQASRRAAVGPARAPTLERR